MKKKLLLTLVVLTTALYLPAQTNKAALTNETLAKQQPTQLNRSSQQGGDVNSLSDSQDLYKSLSSHLTLTVKDAYSVVSDYYVITAPSGPISSPADYVTITVSSTAFDQSEIHFGLFTLQDEPVFIRELINENTPAHPNAYSVPVGFAGGEFILQPYVIKADGTRQILTRQDNSSFVDKLRVIVNKAPQAISSRAALAVNPDITTSKHMRLDISDKGRYVIDKGEVFGVYVPAGQGTSTIGLFDRDKGTLVSNIVTKSYGDVYTCAVPSNIKDGHYVIMPYRTENGEVKVIQRKADSNLIDRLPIQVKTASIGELTDHLEVDLTTTNNLYKVAINQKFLVKAKAVNIQDQVRIGLISATTDVMLIKDITVSYQGNGVYECMVPEHIYALGRYIIEPYIVDANGKMIMVNRPEKSNLIDKLPISVCSSVGTKAALAEDLSNYKSSSNMRLTTSVANQNIVARGEEFEVYIAAGQGSTQIGLFDRAKGAFITNIVKSSFGDVYTCEVPRSIKDGDYVVMPYRVENGVVQVIERKHGLNSVDRLPLSVTGAVQADLFYHFELILSTTNDLYRANVGKPFNVKITCNVAPEFVQIGLFERTDEERLIADVKSSYLGGNIYECILNNVVENGNYIIQPYVLDTDSSVMLIDRPEGTFWIDRLPLAIDNGLGGKSDAYTPSPTVSTSKSMHFLMPVADYYSVYHGESFGVYVSAGQGTTRMGLFDKNTAEFVSDISKIPYGDTFICSVPNSVPEGEYIVMPYRNESGVIKVIERTQGTNLIDRLPIMVTSKAFSERSLVSEDNQSESISLYPNPVVDELHVKNLSGSATIQLYSLSGNLVKTAKVISGESVDLQSIPSGIYMVKVVTESGQVITSKIKKN